MKTPLEHYLRTVEPLSAERAECLWEKYRDGDDAALATLLACFGNRLYRRIWGFVRSDLAEDVFQDVMAKMHRERRGLVTFEDAMKWLRAVAKNQAIDARRRSARRLAREQRAARPEVVTPSDTGQHEAIRSALRQLTDEQREAIALHFFEGLSRIDAATVVGIHRDTFSARLTSAVERLRSLIPAPVLLVLGGALGIESHLAALPIPPSGHRLALIIATVLQRRSFSGVTVGTWKVVGLMATVSVVALASFILYDRPGPPIEVQHDHPEQQLDLITKEVKVPSSDTTSKRLENQNFGEFVSAPRKKIGQKTQTAIVKWSLIIYGSDYFGKAEEDLPKPGNLDMYNAAHYLHIYPKEDSRTRLPEDYDSPIPPHTYQATNYKFIVLRPGEQEVELQSQQLPGILARYSDTDRKKRLYRLLSGDQWVRIGAAGPESHLEFKVGGATGIILVCGGIDGSYAFVTNVQIEYEP